MENKTIEQLTNDIYAAWNKYHKMPWYKFVSKRKLMKHIISLHNERIRRHAFLGFGSNDVKG